MHIPAESAACLDVSSPRLFSLFLAAMRPAVSIHMLNPDLEDAEMTRAIADRLGYSNLAISSEAVSALAGQSGRYDCIWSISVVEHIIGNHGDTEAMRLMYAALRPGGRLIVTVPVDRRFWHEYRAEDYYGIHEVPTQSGEYFFQRLYDEAHVRARLVDPLGQPPTALRWFGERVAGSFHAYERRWIELGPDETIDDPRRIADDYASYESWADMPGFGVCAMVIDKPPDGDQSPAA
jgi:SAM-dependent methyltransferase